MAVKNSLEMIVNSINNQIFPKHEKLSLLDPGFHNYNYFFRRFIIAGS